MLGTAGRAQDRQARTQIYDHALLPTDPQSARTGCCVYQALLTGARGELLGKGTVRSHYADVGYGTEGGLMRVRVLSCQVPKQPLQRNTHATPHGNGTSRLGSVPCGGLWCDQITRRYLQLKHLLHPAKIERTKRNETNDNRRNVSKLANKHSPAQESQEMPMPCIRCTHPPASASESNEWYSSLASTQH